MLPFSLSILGKYQYILYLLLGREPRSGKPVDNSIIPTSMNTIFGALLAETLSQRCQQLRFKLISNEFTLEEE